MRGARAADHRRAIRKRKSHLSAQNGIHPARVTHRQRPIQAILRAHAFDGLCGNARIHAHGRKEVTRRQLNQRERKDRNGGQQEDRVGESSKEVSHVLGLGEAPFVNGFESRHRRKKLFREAVLRPVEEFQRGLLLHDSSFVHYCHLVCKSRNKV